MAYMMRRETVGLRAVDYLAQEPQLSLLCRTGVCTEVYTVALLIFCMPSDTFVAYIEGGTDDDDDIVISSPLTILSC